MILFHLILFSSICKSRDNDDSREGCVLFYILYAKLIDSLLWQLCIYWQVIGSKESRCMQYIWKSTTPFRPSLVYSHCQTSVVQQFNIPDWQTLLSDVQS